jgi:SAM-dependent methyltransferase
VKRRLRRVPGWMVLVRFRSNARRFRIHLAGRWRDLRYRIDTSSIVGHENLEFDADRGNRYEASSWFVINHFLASHPIKATDAFLDLGSGKGRAVLAAARYPFKRVIGVELSSSLNTIARGNVAKMGKHLVCNDVEIVTADIAEYEIPSDVTFIYIFNTVEGGLFQKVVDRICESVASSPRVINLAYYCAEMAEYLTTRGFEEVTESPHIRQFRYP